MHEFCSWLHILMMNVCSLRRPLWLSRRKWNLYNRHLPVILLNIWRHMRTRRYFRFVYLLAMPTGWELCEWKSLDVAWTFWELGMNIGQLLTTRAFFYLAILCWSLIRYVARDLKDNITSYWQPSVIAKVLSPYILEHRITTVCDHSFWTSIDFLTWPDPDLRLRRRIGPSESYIAAWRRHAHSSKLPTCI